MTRNQIISSLERHGWRCQWSLQTGYLFVRKNSRCYTFATAAEAYRVLIKTKPL